MKQLEGCRRVQLEGMEVEERGEWYKSDVWELSNALTQAAKHIYADEDNAERIDSRAERLFVHVGSCVVFYRALNVMSAKRAHDVLAALDANQKKLLAEFPSLDDRERLYQKATEDPLAPFTSDRPNRRRRACSPECERRFARKGGASTAAAAPTTLEPGLDSSVPIGAGAGDDGALEELEGVQRRQPFQSILDVQGGDPHARGETQSWAHKRLNDEIDAHFRAIVRDAFSENGPSVLISLVHCAAVAGLLTTAPVAATTAATVFGLADMAARKRFKRPRQNDAETGTLADLARSALPTVLPTVLLTRTGQTILNNRRAAAWGVSTAFWNCLTVVQQSAQAVGALPAPQVVTPAQAADLYAILPGNEMLTFFPDMIAKYPVAAGGIAAAVGAAMLAYYYEQREALYAPVRVQRFLALNDLDDAVHWERKTKRSIEMINLHNAYPVKEPTKTSIGSLLKAAMDDRRANPLPGQSVVAQIDGFIKAMQSVEDLIRDALYNQPGQRENDITRNILPPPPPPPPPPPAPPPPPPPPAPPRRSARRRAGAAAVAVDASVVEQVFAAMQRMRAL